MLTCKTTDRFAARVFAGLVLTVAVVMGSLTYAVAHMQAYA